MSEIDARLFRETMGHYPTGVAAVTGIGADGRPAGMVVGTFNSVSLDPPLVGFFPTAGSPSFGYLREAKSFCVNVLAADQGELCRRFASGGADKFEGVGWRPAPHAGAPILDGVVSWVECTYHDIQEAGDHLFVLGRVQHLAIERSTLPLLFFQGGYGRFTARSFVAAPDPQLIQAALLAEAIRPDAEAFSLETGANCSVMAKIGWDTVHVLSADARPDASPFDMGHRMPIVPPLGATLVTGSSEQTVGEWLDQAPRADEERRRWCRDLLATVEQNGFTVLTAAPASFQRHREAVATFVESDRMPRHQADLQQTTQELGELYELSIEPGRTYTIESVVVPVPVVEGSPRMSIRVSGVTGEVSGETILHWVERLQQLARTLADAAALPRTPGEDERGGAHVTEDGAI